MIQTASMVLRNGTKLLSETLGEAAPRDARILMATALGVPMDRLTLVLSQTINPTQVAHFESLIKRRAAREPISHITGKRLFWGLEFRVTADVLDPRPETETLVDLALSGPPPATILDLGTGSGCILISLLDAWATATGTGTDTSANALTIARQNATALGVSDRATFTAANWFDGLQGRFDLVVSNPPYIDAAELASLQPEVRKYEPHAALSPGPDGLDPYRKIANKLAQFLAPDGRAYFEIGHTQGPAALAIFHDAGFPSAAIHQDLNGHDRIVAICP